jgi:GNAT acetyltransferase-like protein
VQVRSIRPRDDPRWDAYVRAHPDAHAVHLAAYQETVERAYRSAGRHLALFEGDVIRGVLPLVLRRGPVSGRRLRSLPGVTAGPLTDDAAGAAALLRAARDVAERERSTLGVNARVTGLDLDRAGVSAVAAPPAWVLRLAAPPADLRRTWRRSSNLARSLRKAEAAGMRVRAASGGADLRAFHRLYAATMRKHMSLPRTLGQLRLERRLLGPEVARLWLVEHRGTPVAGAYFHAFNGRLVLVYNASDAAALPLRPNHVLYWETIRWAWERGLPEYDFGFAWPGSTLADFKAQWGAEPVQEVFYAHPPADQTAGAVPGAADDRVRRLAGHVPVAAVRLAGAVAYRYL